MHRILIVLDDDVSTDNAEVARLLDEFLLPYFQLGDSQRPRIYFEQDGREHELRAGAESIGRENGPRDDIDLPWFRDLYARLWGETKPALRDPLFGMKFHIRRDGEKNLTPSVMLGDRVLVTVNDDTAEFVVDSVMSDGGVKLRPQD